MATVQQWMKFFLAAGIPNANAAGYASNFSNNRIEMSMLMDLDKEYLKDLDVKYMGDIIKILKYAKKVDEKVAMDLVLSGQESKKATPNAAGGEAIAKDGPRHHRGTERTKIDTDMVESDSVGRRVMGAEKSKITAKNPAPDTRRTTTVTLVKKSPAIPGEARKAELSKAKLTSRLGPKVVDEKSVEPEPKNSVFSRLGDQEHEKMADPKESKSSIFKRLDSAKKELKTTDKLSKGSAFDRLEASDSTQVGHVSSSDDQLDNNPGRGILKQRGLGAKGGLVKSKSASTIISLKPKETTKKATRVSFGETDVRHMSPRPAAEGIKARLGVPAHSNAKEAENEEPEDLRQYIKASNKLSSASAPASETRASASEARASLPEARAPSSSQQGVGAASSAGETAEGSSGTQPRTKTTICTKKRFYIVRTLSDGTKEKNELTPNDELYWKLSERSRMQEEKNGTQADPEQSSPSTTIRQTNAEKQLQLEQLRQQSRVINQRQIINPDGVGEGLTIRESRAARSRELQDGAKRIKLEDAATMKPVRQEVNFRNMPDVTGSLSRHVEPEAGIWDTVQTGMRSGGGRFETLAARATKLSSQDRDELYEDERILLTTSARQFGQQHLKDDQDHREQQRFERDDERQRSRDYHQREQQSHRDRENRHKAAGNNDEYLSSSVELRRGDRDRRDAADESTTAGSGRRLVSRSPTDLEESRGREMTGQMIAVRFPDQTVANRTRYDKDLDIREEKLIERERRVSEEEGALRRIGRSSNSSSVLPQRSYSDAANDDVRYSRGQSHSDDDVEILSRRPQLSSSASSAGGTMRADQAARPPASERLTGRSMVRTDQSVRPLASERLAGRGMARDRSRSPVWRESRLQPRSHSHNLDNRKSRREEDFGTRSGERGVSRSGESGVYSRLGPPKISR